MRSSLDFITWSRMICIANLHLNMTSLPDRTRPQPPQGKQMIIYENEPAELPKDVVRCSTKTDDGIGQLNVNLNSILHKFERGLSNGSSKDDDEDDWNDANNNNSQTRLVDKPSLSIKETLMAFESRGVTNHDDATNGTAGESSKRPVVKKLTNINGFLNRQNSNGNGQDESQSATTTPAVTNRPLAVRRSESLMMRLKKYESRVNGESVDDDDDDDDDSNSDKDVVNGEENGINGDAKSSSGSRRSSSTGVAKAPILPVVRANIKSLKNRWENGEVNNKMYSDDDEDNAASENGQSPAVEKYEELNKIRQSLASRKRMFNNVSNTDGPKTTTPSSAPIGKVKNIYESAIREKQMLERQQQQQALAQRRESNSVLISEIQQQLLQQNQPQQNSQSKTTPNSLITMTDIASQSNDCNGSDATLKLEELRSLKSMNRANKLKEMFESGQINNSVSCDDESGDNNANVLTGATISTSNGGENSPPPLSKLEQLRLEKLEDLNLVAQGETRTREARNMFKQIERQSSTVGQTPPLTSSRRNSNNFRRISGTIADNSVGPITNTTSNASNTSTISDAPACTAKGANKVVQGDKIEKAKAITPVHIESDLITSENSHDNKLVASTSINSSPQSTIKNKTNGGEIPVANECVKTIAETHAQTSASDTKVDDPVVALETSNNKSAKNNVNAPVASAKVNSSKSASVVNGSTKNNLTSPAAAPQKAAPTPATAAPKPAGTKILRDKPIKSIQRVASIKNEPTPPQTPDASTNAAKPQPIRLTNNVKT